MIPSILLLAVLFASPQMKPPSQTPAQFRIAGIVVDADTGAPLSLAQVSISLDGSHFTVAADDNGRFLFDNLRPGRYQLSASAPGYVRSSYDQHGYLSTAIVVGPGLDAGHLVFTLVRQAVIYGTVTDQHGDAVDNAQVILLEESRNNGTQQSTMRGTYQTDDLGEYRIAHLSPGNYYVAVEAHPWYAENGFKYPVQTSPPPTDGSGIQIWSGRIDPPEVPLLDMVYPLTFYPNVTDSAQASEITLIAGEQEEADVQLTPVPAVHVLLTDLPGRQSNRRSSYVGIGATQKAFGSSLPVMHGPEERRIAPGEWELAGLPPGPLTLSIQANGTNGQDFQTLSVDLANGDTVDASSSPAPSAVSGRVILPGQGAIPLGAEVMFSGQPEGRSFPVHLEKDGTFSQALAPGTYGLQVWASGSTGLLYLRNVSATGAQVSGRSITIPGSSSVYLTLTLGRGVGTVNGVARLAAKPAAGAFVLLVPASGQNFQQDSRRDQTDSDGSFTLANIIPGKYVLLAIADGWNLAWSDPAALKPYRDKGQIVEVAPGQSLTVTATVQPLQN